MTWSREDSGIVKWFHAESTGAHNFGGPIDNQKDEDRVRRIYAPGQKSIVSLRIETYELVRFEEWGA